ncbi:MAG: hypothetical protein COV29_02880 [Candidatus Yanofskybacteria bacterium CG10_big_fil_rev_8_21_14_0_10_36_16]|uniref:Uncharacterized protein n=1 Tax=Candidatus Yanofskybacteria bacterium CG10_big_fil_rev_8_21_14_0_10_36_16 TaxID=1975096 RepID=A0A2J0Q6S8_9BACT|nr:MAG: hypothetical protein COV29_02880 [Candidatus Yanofskybacteria bacterium CG10_big_fil_rev_8_21_14_0_10_36_16]
MQKNKFFLIITLTLLIASVGYLLYQQYNNALNLGNLNEDLFNLKHDVNNVKSDVDDIKDVFLSKLLIYRNEELGIEFQYPAEWGSIDFSIQPANGTEGVPGIGESFWGRFNKAKLSFGGVTKDFSEPRGKSFMDFAGNPGGAEADNPTKVIILNEEKKVFIFADGIPDYPILGPPLLSNNARGARAYLSGPKFYGIAFVYNQIPQEEVELFDQMLSSIKYLR